MAENSSELHLLKAHAYAKSVRILVKDRDCWTFTCGELINPIEAVNGKGTVGSGELPRCVHIYETREKWTHYINIFNAGNETLAILPEVFKHDRHLIYSLDLAVDYHTRSRHEAHEVAKFLLGHLVQPRSKDPWVAVTKADEHVINAGLQVAYEFPPDVIYFASKRDKERLVFDRDYLWYPPSNVFRLYHDAVTAEDRPCCRIVYRVKGTGRIKKFGIDSISQLAQLNFKREWNRLLVLAEIDDDALVSHLRRNGCPWEEVRHAISAVRRSTQIELDGDMIPSVHNLYSASGISLTKIQRIGNSRWLPDR